MSSLLTLVSSAGLLDLALKSIAIMLLACVLTVLLGRASAAWRHLVWFLAVASLLLLPALSLALPAWRVTWLPQWSAQPTPLVATPKTIPAPTSHNEPRVVQSPDTIVLPSSTNPAATETPISSPATTIEASRAARGPMPWLTIAWAAGGLLSFIPLAVGLAQLAAFRRGSRVIDDSRWLTLLGELRRQLAVRRSVQLRCTEAALVPLTWGALRPVLLVPAEANAWPDERRRLVLLHELAHIHRWDWLTQLMAHVACALYWFNPLVWLAARQMRIERERACDDLVLASGARASDYAQELLTLAACLSDARLSNLVAVPMARRGALEDRLRGILDNRRSRAALTTVAVCLGAALAAAAIAPLAMLRAAPPPPVEEAMSDDPKPEDKPAAPEEFVDRAHGISISVMNAKGDRGIPEFRVIAGVNSGGVASEFEKRTGQTVISWQPHTCRVGKNGSYVWPLDKAYPEMSLRIEADGHEPQIVTGIKKANGAAQLVFLLSEDKGAAGRVLTPDGKPAAGAMVALALPQQEIVWEEGKLRGADLPLPEKPGDRWRRPRLFKADAEGRFRLPTEIEPAAVLVIHDSGVLEMSYAAWKESPDVKLQKWGSIAGQVLWQDKPGADEEINLTIHRDDYGYPGMIASYENARTDQQGKFTFDRVLPGLVQISRPIKTAEPNTSVTLNGMLQHVKVKPGDPTPVLLGGQGRKVTGKFVGLDSWEGATYHFHPEAPHVGRPGDNAMWEGFSQLKASLIGPVLFRDKQPVNKDGTFTIERMLPGRYQLFLSVPGAKNYAAYTRIQIEPEAPGEKPAPLELKDIATVNKTAESQVSDEKPAEKPIEKPAEKPAAKTVTIRGKVLDDATGEPIGKLITQAGKFEPADPTKVTWGYSEGRSSARDGSFSTTVRWGDGWTARILADGYIPQPVITSAPPADKDEIEVTVRLKRGPKVRGIVLDHAGKPVKDAAVFAVGPTGLNLSAGQSTDNESQPVRTDAEGRFELPIGEAKSLAVSHATFDAWPAAIPAKGELTIRLPQPARVDVALDIAGADKESEIFYQLLTQGRKEFAGVRIERETKMANPGTLLLAALPPGKYQLSRNVMNRLGEIGFGAMLDRQFFEVKAGETKVINFVRDKGARVRGKVTWPADTRLMGTVVSVQSLKAEKSPFDEHEWTTTFASHAAAADGTFLTERIAPGKYLLLARAYVPLTPEQRFRTGAILPSFQAETKIEVPAEGELVVDNLILKPSRRDE
jgi:beta-lactamase regulating signal transducer with metallopeptidase domain